MGAATERNGGGRRRCGQLGSAVVQQREREIEGERECSIGFSELGSAVVQQIRSDPLGSGVVCSDGGGAAKLGFAPSVWVHGCAHLSEQRDVAAKHGEGHGDRLE